MHRRFFAACCILGLAESTFAQSCAGDPGIGLAVSDSSPTIGSSFTLTTQTNVGDVVLLLVGASGAPTATPYGTLCVALPTAIVPFVQIAPSVVLSASIPFDTSYAGLTPHFQFLSAAEGGSTVHRSNGLGITIGSVAGPDYPGRSYDSPELPADPAFADLNADSNLDVVTPCPQAGLVTFGFGTGSGEFVSGAPLAVTNFPSAVLLRDFDSDGRLDLVVVRNGEFQVWKGLGATHFTLATTVTGFVAPRALTGGDFDLDGKIDLAVTDGFAGNAKVSRGLGSFAFGTPTAYAIGVTPLGIDEGDLNVDGDPDLVIAHTGVPSGVRILTGSSGVAFTSIGTYPTGDQAVDVVIVDFDADGRDDLAVSNHLSDTVTVLRNKTSFFASTNYAVGHVPFGLIASDLDGDSHQDLVVANRGATSLGLLRGDGLGFFAPMVIHETPELPEFVAAGDLDGDARPDLVTARYYDDALSVDLDRNGHGFGLEGTPSIPSMGGLRVAVLGDFDSDTRTDVVGIDNLNSVLRRYSGDGEGGFTAEPPVAIPASPIDVVTADLDNDADLDVLTSSQSLATIGVLLGDGGGNFTSSTQPGLIQGQCATGDVDQDGVVDLVSVGRAPIGLSTILQSFVGVGDGTFVAQPSVPSASDPTDLALGDLDLDGDLDALVTNSSTNSPQLLRGDGLGGFASAGTLELGDTSRAVALADLDADGDLDAAIANGTLLNLTPFHANGPLTFSVGAPVVVDSGVSGIAIADIDGDQRLDLVLARKLKATVRVAFGSPTGTFLTQHDFRSVLGNETILVGSIDANARPDIVTASAVAPNGLSILRHR